MARGKRLRNPFHGVTDILSEMGRMSEQMTSAGDSAEYRPRGFADAWSPTLDIFASGDDLVIRADLPGITSEDVEVSLAQSTLSLSGDRPVGKEADNEFYVRERVAGRFRRDIGLPDGVRENQISATFNDGVLEVTVQDCAKASGPSQIPIRG